MPPYVRITMVDGSMIVIRDATPLSRLAKQLIKKGFFESTMVETPEDSGTAVVVMQASVSMLSAYSLPPTATGAVKITSVPSKTRN